MCLTDNKKFDDFLVEYMLSAMFTVKTVQLILDGNILKHKSNHKSIR